MTRKKTQPIDTQDQPMDLSSLTAEAQAAHPVTLDEQALQRAAIAALGIDVPIYRCEMEGQATIVLYLYGHTGPVRWTWPDNLE